MKGKYPYVRCQGPKLSSPDEHHTIQRLEKVDEFNIMIQYTNSAQG
jgi:hypothetical protein